MPSMFQTLASPRPDNQTHCTKTDKSCTKFAQGLGIFTRWKNVKKMYDPQTQVRSAPHPPMRSFNVSLFKCLKHSRLSNPVQEKKKNNSSNQKEKSTLHMRKFKPVIFVPKCHKKANPGERQ